MLQIIRKISLIAMFAIASVLSFAEGESAESIIHVNVQGMVCDFCARGLEKVFSKREEVEDIDVNLSDRLITIYMKPNASLDDETIKELVVSNGISVETIHRQ